MESNDSKPHQRRVRRRIQYGVILVTGSALATAAFVGADTTGWWWLTVLGVSWVLIAAAAVVAGMVVDYRAEKVQTKVTALMDRRPA